MEKTWNSCESFQGLFLIKFHHEGIDNSQKSKTTQDSNRRNCRLCSLQIKSVFIILSLERNHAKIVSMGKLHCKKHWTKMLVAHDNKQVRNTVDSGWDWVTQSAPTHKWHVCHVHLLAPVNHIPTCHRSHLTFAKKTSWWAQSLLGQCSVVWWVRSKIRETRVLCIWHKAKHSIPQ